ncbi:MAG: ABC transporter ATP-binding protein [Gemmatimonadaceae bacterium]
MPCVSARGVTKRYGDRVALDSVDIDVEAGRVVGLVGPNGAGKTTLLHAMLGWLPVNGDLRVLGMDPWHNRSALMREVSFVADVSTMPRWLRVSQAVSYVEGVHPRFQRARTAALLATTGIAQGDRVGQLSKGMIAQLHLALAMGVDAPLMLLDEPTLGLDPLYRLRFYEMLMERFAEGDRTVIIATHDVDELQHMLTDLVFLDNGHVVFRCTADEYEDRFVEVHVHPEHLELARDLDPIHERPALAGRLLLFDGADRERLSLFGDLRRPSVGALFAAVVERSRNGPS